jgi:moderate conductance mechanosensitive channel
MRSLAPRPFCLAVLLIAVGPSATLADAPPAPDVATRVAELRALLASQQGVALLDLLNDPNVRQAITQDQAPATAGGTQQATAGEMMDDLLTTIRQRLRSLATEFGRLPDELAAIRARIQVLLPGSDLLQLFGFILLFLAGGVGAQRLLFHSFRRWRAHFDALTLCTARERARAAAERLLFGVLLIAAFAAGSMGTFLLFAWPAATESTVLGYLFAFLTVRLSLTATRFFFAPAVERLRLVGVSTQTAWFWHRWTARMIGTSALGWQTILMLRSFGMSQAGTDVLLQLLLLLLTGLGLFIVWTMPGTSRERVRGAMPRVLASLGLLLDWLLFLTGAWELGWTLLILAAIPVVTFLLSRSISTVVHGDVPVHDADRSPYAAIAERTMQAFAVIIAAGVLVRVWQIDMIAMSNLDTPMTRIARGLLEALVILVVSDLLWQVVRVLIDTRLASEQLPIDALDDDARRRRARLHTLLPVLRNFALFIVLVMASLSALAAMGLQIGPLLAGAGVVGIAVGFGAQTLVRDILSGVFFLLDDAFRVGEYIESGGIRGTVESFSLRSVKLRDLNGHLHTVPFGDLKAITNFSRDWVVETLHAVVTYDTDLDLLERVVTAVSDELAADPVMAPQMIEPLQSLGVQAMVDTGMQIGLMFKTRPGRQFAVRRAVFSRIKLAFAAHGIRFASALLQPVVEAAATG